MINRLEARLGNISIHKIGIAAEDEGVKISKASIELSNDNLHPLLLSYFFDKIIEPEFFHFTYTSGETELNPVYNFVSNIFDDPSQLHGQSIKIARFLYEQSKHPNIKGGDLMIAYVQDVLVDDELVNAVAIFKSENKDAFIKLNLENGNYDIDLENGIHIEKLDKACLIFETERDKGYKVCVVDKSNLYNEAQYWRDDFLHVTSRKDDYFATTQYISLTKSYVKERLKHEDGATKIDEADIMHRSKEYLKNVETFDRSDFEDSVFRNQNLKSSFQDYSEDFESERQISLPDSFEVSEKAIKRKSRSFRSVIKLDKNFHVYVHGDRSKIERIEEVDGTKYYKLFFDSES